jgi:hypothetical protein
VERFAADTERVFLTLAGSGDVTVGRDRHRKIRSGHGASIPRAIPSGTSIQTAPSGETHRSSRLNDARLASSTVGRAVMIAVFAFWRHGVWSAGRCCREKQTTLRTVMDRPTRILANGANYGNERWSELRAFGGDELVLTGAWEPITLGT